MNEDEAHVLRQNAAFYAAFDGRDADAMAALWALRAPCACLHPGGRALFGREEILASFRSILGGAGSPRIRPEEPRAHVLGDTAFVVCREQLASRGRPGSATLVATNVFTREDGSWRIVHHHAAAAGPDPGGIDEDDDDDPPPSPRSLN